MIREAINHAMIEQGINLHQVANQCSINSDKLQVFLDGGDASIRLNDIEKVLEYLKLKIVLQ